MAFDASYQATSHSAFKYEDKGGAMRQRTLPDINSRLSYEVADAEPREGPADLSYGTSGKKLVLNDNALNRTYVQTVRSRYAAEQRWRRTAERQNPGFEPPPGGAVAA